MKRQATTLYILFFAQFHDKLIHWRLWFYISHLHSFSHQNTIHSKVQIILLTKHYCTKWFKSIFISTLKNHSLNRHELDPLSQWNDDWRITHYSFKFTFLSYASLLFLSSYVNQTQSFIISSWPRISNLWLLTTTVYTRVNKCIKN